MTRIRYFLFSTLLVITALASLLFSFPAQAQDPPLEQGLEGLAIGADSIVMGTVVDHRSQWNDGHTRIYSSVDVTVEETLKGTVDANTITITVPGGEADGITEWVSDMPNFNKGEKIVGFLKHHQKDKYEIFGSSQGKLTIVQDKVSDSKLPIAKFKEQINQVLRGEVLPQETIVNSTVTAAGLTVGYITPDAASAGTGSQVTITGNGFGPNPGSVNFFYRSGQPAIKGTIVSWSDTSINALVPTDIINGYPASAGSGPLYVQTADGAISNNYSFAVTFSYGGVKWPGTNPAVNYWINPNTADTAGEDTAVRNAATTWSNVPNNNFSLNYAGATTATGYGYDGKNEIMWVNLGNSSVLARTIYWYSGSTIIETDLEFNDYYNWSAAATTPSGWIDVESIALHELGHFLNLRDLYGNLTGYDNDTAKVMYGFGSSGVTKRILSAGDQAGVQWIYPAAATPGSLTLAVPNSGESWQAGTTHAITWGYSGSPGSYVGIELLKGGVSNRVISSNASVGSGGNGLFNWTVPSSQTAGSDYKIRITSTTNSAISDASDNNFTITGAPAPTVTVNLPNSGESWQAGTTHAITWRYSGSPGSYVRIELLKGGVTNRVISSYASAGSGGNGLFNWTVPSLQTAGSDYKIRITSTTNSAISDTSDNNFTITGAPAPTMTVNLPNSGESWQAGTTHAITWRYTGSPGSYVRIELLKGGVTNRVISSYASAGSGGNGLFNWTVPSLQTAGSDYKIRITSTTNSAISDTSDNNFTITGAPAPTITVNLPNSGESWQAGTAHAITWRYSGSPGSYVRIELLKGGVSNRVISSYASAGSGGNGLFNWTVPSSQTAGSDYKIRITGTTNSAISDASDNNFTITGIPAPTMTVNLPNSGESWQAGTTHAITWRYSGSPGSYVRIELLKGGVSNRVIISNASVGSSGNGLFNWTVPSSQTAGIDYKIRITSTTNSVISDASDNNFTITGIPAPTMTVNLPNSGESWKAGTPHAISWRYSGSPGSYVRIELLKGGVSNRVISSYASVGSGGNGLFNWTVPSSQTAGSDYKIRITSTTNSAISDASDNNFTVTVP